jgi:hypothetical protein
MPKSKHSKRLEHIPLVIILAAMAAFAALLLSGGMRRVYDWNLLPLFLPGVGLAGFVYSLVRLMVRKRLDGVTARTTPARRTSTSTTSAKILRPIRWTSRVRPPTSGIWTAEPCRREVSSWSMASRLPVA